MVGSVGRRSLTVRGAMTAAVCAALVVLSACSGSHRTSSPTTSMPTAAGQLATQPRALGAQMLSAREVGRGWSNNGSRRIPGTELDCNLQFDGDASPAAQEREVFETNATQLPGVGEILAAYSTVADARATFASVANSTCEGAGFVRSPSGKTLGTQGASWSAPLYWYLSASDETRAFRESDSIVEGRVTNTVGIDRLVARRGRDLVMIYLVEPHDPDSHMAFFGELIRAALAKISDWPSTKPYQAAERACRAHAARQGTSTRLLYAGVTTVGDLGGNEPWPKASEASLLTEAEALPVIVCSDSSLTAPLVQTYIDARGRVFPAPISTS